MSYKVSQFFLKRNQYMDNRRQTRNCLILEWKNSNMTFYNFNFQYLLSYAQFYKSFEAKF